MVLMRTLHLITCVAAHFRILVSCRKPSASLHRPSEFSCGSLSRLTPLSCARTGPWVLQGMCEGDSSNHDAMWTATLALFCLIGVVVLGFVILFVTDRCGCYCKCFKKHCFCGTTETQRHRRLNPRSADDFGSKLVNSKVALISV